MIDRERLHRRVLFDSSTLVAALAHASADADASGFRDLFNAYLEKGSTVLVAAPSFAELLRRPEANPLPRREGLVVVAFDATAARVFSERMPLSAITQAKGTGAPAAYIKYDALIIACAIRHRAEAIITKDGKQSAMARTVNMPCPSLAFFEQAQLPLDLISEID